MRLHVGRLDIIGGAWGSIPSQVFETFHPPARFVGKIWSGLATCPPTGSPTTGAPSRTPTSAPVTGAPTASPSRSPTPAPSTSPTSEPTRRVTETVVGNELVLDFSGGGGGDGGDDGVRSLQSDDGCLDAAEEEMVGEMLQLTARGAYGIDTTNEPASGSTRVTWIKITVTGHEDVSPAGDCSKVMIIYDQEMEIKAGGSEEISVAELIQLPLATPANRDVFVSNLIQVSGGDSVFKSMTGAEEVAVTEEGLSTRSPTSSPSVSFIPTKSPTFSPTSLPSLMPSISSRPSISAVPSSFPSTAPSTSSSPTSSVEPSSSPSMTPSDSTRPSNGPSSMPSMMPSVSQAPSSAPSEAPSLAPSYSPSESPSQGPSTLLNYMSVKYQFDIWFPPEDEENVKSDIIGNVTDSFNRIFADESDPVLLTLVQYYDLGFSLREGEEARVDMDDSVADEDLNCITDDDPASANNECHRFILNMYFQHERSITGGIVRGWILEVSDQVSGDLVATYSGDESVRTSQVMVLANIEQEPSDEDYQAICDILQEQVSASEAFANFTILGVDCAQFVWVAGATTSPDVFDRGLRRRILKGAGTLNIDFEIHAEYKPASRGENEDMKDAEFAKLVEDSINSDVGKEIGATLNEREILVMDEDSVQSFKKRTDTPTLSPTPEGQVRPYADLSGSAVAESSSNSSFGTTAIAVIITGAVVVIVIAGFLFYKGMQRSGTDDEKLYPWDDLYLDDFLSDDTKISPAELGSEENVRLSHDEPIDDDSPTNRLPGYYSGTETNIFGKTVGLGNMPGTTQTSELLDEKIQIHDSIKNSEEHHVHIGDTIDDFSRWNPVRNSSGHSTGSRASASTFEDRLHQKLARSRSPSPGNLASRSSSRQLDAKESLVPEHTRSKENYVSSGNSIGSRGSTSTFEDRLHQKLARTGNLAPRSSSRQLDDFEARIAAKSKEGEKNKSRESSPAAILSYEERLKSKIKSVDLNRSRSLRRELQDNSIISRGSTSTFEDRLHQKLASSRSPSPGNLAPRSSSRQLDDFEARIAAKSKEGEKNRSRESSPTAILSYEERLKSKIKSVDLDRSHSLNSIGSRGSTSTFEDRLHQKLASSRSPSPGDLAPRSSSRQLDDFEARIAAKSKEGDNKQSGLISSKKHMGDKNRARGRSPGPAPSYGDLLERKLSGGSLKKTHGQLPEAVSSSSSSRRLDALEARIAAKNNEEGKKRSSSASPGLDLSYEDRLQKKLAERATNKTRSKSPRSHSYSSSRLDDFNARVAAKSKEGDVNRSRNGSPGGRSLSRNTSPRAHSSSSSRLDDFNARVAAKSKEGDVNRSRNGSQGGRSLSRRTSPGAHSSSSSRLDDFNARVAAKSKEGDRNKSRNGSPGGRSLSRSTSPGAHSSSSMSNRLDDFNARISVKSKEGDGDRSRNGSPGGRSLSLTSQHLDDFHSRIVAKSMESGGAPSSLRSRGLDDSNDARIVKQPTIGAISSSSSSMRLDDFQSRIAAKSKVGDEIETPGRSTGSASLPSNHAHSIGAVSSPSSARNLDHFEASIAAKKNEGDKNRSRGTSPGLAQSYENRLQRKRYEGNSDTTRSGSPEAHSSSSERLDEFHARIAAKANEGDGNRSRDGSPGAQSLSSASQQHLDDFQSRIIAKSKQGDFRSSKQPEGSASRRGLDDYEARFSAKSETPFSSPREQIESNKNIGRGALSLNGRFNAAYAKARAVNTVKDVNHSDARAAARIRHNELLSNKLQGQNIGISSTEADSGSHWRHARNSSQPTVQPSIESHSTAHGMERKDSNERLDEFEAKTAKLKLQQKLKGISAGKHTERKDSKERLDEFEAKIARKAKAGGTSQGRAQGEPNSSHPSVTSYELKLQQKLKGKSAGKHIERKDSKERLDEFEAKIARKAKAGGTSQGRTSSGSSLNSSQPSATSYELKLQQKLEGKSAGKSMERKDSKERLDEFEAKIARKANGGDM